MITKFHWRHSVRSTLDVSSIHAVFAVRSPMFMSLWYPASHRHFCWFIVFVIRATSTLQLHQCRYLKVQPRNSNKNISPKIFCKSKTNYRTMTDENSIHIFVFHCVRDTERTSVFASLLSGRKTKNEKRRFVTILWLSANLFTYIWCWAASLSPSMHSARSFHNFHSILCAIPLRTNKITIHAIKVNRIRFVYKNMRVRARADRAEGANDK